MAYPVIESTAIYEAASGVSHTITLPADIEVGDLLVMIQTNDQNPATRETGMYGWNRLLEGSADGVDSGRVLWRIADGTEDGSRTFNVSASESVNCVTFRISGANSIVAAQDENIGFVAYDDQVWPALTFGWSADSLVLRAQCRLTAASTPPSGFTAGPIAGAVASSQSYVETFYKNLTGSSIAAESAGSLPNARQFITVAVANISTGGGNAAVHPLSTYLHPLGQQ